jgi:hypothetical protein
MARIKVKPVGLWKKKWKESHGMIPARYKDGVEAAQDVVNAMVAGQANYEARMNDPNVLKRREERLRQIDDSFWKKRTLEKGVKRIREGMELGTDRYNKAAEISAAALESVDLPERTADWETNVENRTKEVIRALKRAWGKE